MIFRRFLGDWNVFPQGRKRSNRVYVAVTSIGVLLITIGGFGLYKLQKEHTKATQTVAQAQKEADDEVAAQKIAADEAAAQKIVADEIAAKKKADDEAATKKKADEEAAAKKKADEEAATKEKADGENMTVDPKIVEQIPVAPPVNSQSPWERPATEGYSPWGMATTRQMDALNANRQAMVSHVQQAQIQPTNTPAIPTAPGTLGQRTPGTVSPPTYNNSMVNSMVAPPSVGMTSYRPYAPPPVLQQQAAVPHHGRIPVAESQLTYQNVHGMTASGHYAPSAVHAMSTQMPPAIRPLGPIPGQAAPSIGNAPQLASTAPAINYQSQPVYQPQTNYQSQPVYQPQTNYQSQPNYQPQPNHYPQTNYPQPNHQPGRLY